VEVTTGDAAVKAMLRIRSISCSPTSICPHGRDRATKAIRAERWRWASTHTVIALTADALETANGLAESGMDGFSHQACRSPLAGPDVRIFFRPAYNPPPHDRRKRRTAPHSRGLSAPRTLLMLHWLFVRPAVLLVGNTFGYWLRDDGTTPSIGVVTVGIAMLHFVAQSWTVRHRAASNRMCCRRAGTQA